MEEALAIYRDTGDRQGEAEALNEHGMLHRARGDLLRAHDCHRQALDQARAISSARDEARALAGLGRCALAAGDTTQARVMLRRAHDIFERIGAGSDSAGDVHAAAVADYDVRGVVDREVVLG